MAADALALDGVSIRGDSATGTISIGRLVAPLITLPTETGGRFQTFANDRPIAATRAIDYRARLVTFGPFTVARDAFSHRQPQDERQVLAAHDTWGDSDDATTNTYFTRFFFHQPTFSLKTHYVPRRAAAWGKHLYGLHLRCELSHGATRQTLAPVLRAGNVRPRSSPHIPSSTRGSGGGWSRIIYRYTHMAQAYPGQMFNARGMTSRFDADITFRPVISARTPMHGRKLWLRIWLTPQIQGLTSAEAFSSLASNLEFSASTLG